jgi:ABC-type nitrate/sulfonate/bicarbonate transport system substrate-binding protein
MAVKTKSISAILARGLGVAVVIFIGIDFCGLGVAGAESVRVAMPSKSMTFLNFYLGEKFGLYSADGLNVSLEVMKSDIGVAAMLAGEIDYMTGIGTTLRGAATGVPLKATMFTMDKVIFYMMAKPEITAIGDLKGGKSVAVSGLVATDAYGARIMAKAHGLNPDKDLVFIAVGGAAERLAALQGGSVAVAMLSIPFNFKAEALGFRNLGGTAYYLKTPFAGLGVSDLKLRSNPDQVKRMIRATVRGIDYTKDAGQMERVIAYIMEEFKLDRRTAELSYREIVKALTEHGMAAEDTVKSEIEFMRSQAKIKGQVSISQVVDYSLLKEVLAEMKR